MYKFKAKDSDIVATPLCLKIFSRYWSVDNMKKTGFSGYAYDFSVDYDAIDADDIKDIHKYLMKKNNIVNKAFQIYYKNIFNRFIKFNKSNSVEL